MDKINKHKSFNALEQGHARSISEKYPNIFKKQFDTSVRYMRGANTPETNGGNSAIWYLKR
jgi:hypothetical protein